MMIRQTHTFATLEVSRQAYDEVAGLLREADYAHCFIDEGDPAGPIDMHGIALVPKDDRQSAFNDYMNRIGYAVPPDVPGSASLQLDEQGFLGHNPPGDGWDASEPLEPPPCPVCDIAAWAGAYLLGAAALIVAIWLIGLAKGTW